jgi:DnaK suppressor protein
METVNQEKFKEILENRKAQLLKSIVDYKNEISQLQSSEAKDEADFATISSDSAIEEAITGKQRVELEDIEYSLGKIREGSYGTCEMCEEPIAEARLAVKPQARYCIVCREIVEKTS